MRSLLIALLTLVSGQTLADSHGHHVRHNMVVHGVDDVFASHIVYKQPHHFQVILSVRFPGPVLEAYRKARAEHPSDTFIFLLDPGDISEIRNAVELSGSFFRRDTDGKRVDIATAVTLESGTFRVEYFQELPLSLEPD